MPNVIGKLPPAAEAIFKAAVAVGKPGSLARRTAVDRALDQVQAEFPEYFVSVPEQQIENQNWNCKMKININGVRPGFLKCFRAEVPQGGGDPKFGTKLVIPTDHPQIKQIDDAMLAVAEAKWPGKGKQILANMVKTGKPKNIEVPFVREEYANGDGEVYDGFEDAYYFSCSAAANKRPLVIDRDKSVLVEADGRPYSGCKANVQVELWAQDNKFGKAIRAEFKAIQFVADGDSFAGGTPASADDFDDVVDGADAGDLA